MKEDATLFFSFRIFENPALMTCMYGNWMRAATRKREQKWRHAKQNGGRLLLRMRMPKQDPPGYVDEVAPPPTPACLEIP